MSRRLNSIRRLRPQRRRFFIGCEGESERGFVAFLQRIADEEGLLVHLDGVLLQPGGGDPCGIIQMAIELSDRRASRHGAYQARFVLLDSDKLGQTPQRDNQAMQAAIDSSLSLIWQDPCHEAMLLRHLDGCENLRPPTTPVALQQLCQRWPEYRKPMTSVRLAARISLTGVRQFAEAEAGYCALVNAIGFR